MRNKTAYHLNKDNAFIIENYHLAKPFSSFFPGIAGKWGIPMWVFYANRGQAIASFGIKDKDHPILEFQPANKAYYMTPILGFRTFIKLHQGKKDLFYDAFSGSLHRSSYDIKNSMQISSGELVLKEINHTLGLEVIIEYFTIPEDSYAALARKVSIKNIGKGQKRISLLDGLPQIQPYGLNNMFLKQMSRTIEAWFMVENLNKGVPFFRLKVEPADRPEVVHVKQGNFYACFDDAGIIKPIVEKEQIFGVQNDFSFPKTFVENKGFRAYLKQSVKSKTPCAFAFKNVSLKPHDSYSLYAITGNTDSIDRLKADTSRITNTGYFGQKQNENRAVVASLQEPVFTKSSSKALDLYCKQNFLDNIMRGGYPLSIDHASGKTSLYLYSRKHGDMERDYNMFLLEPTCFSQGNGNYRDVNQNRRCDIWFNPSLGRECILNFFNLIQTDGYNPLVVRPDRFRFNQDFTCLAGFFNRYNMKQIKVFLESDFTPGELFSFIDSNQIMLIGSRPDLLKTVMENSTKYFQAVHGEGFWIDHWHYCLDILESYLGLYPENSKEILFQVKEFTFFDNAHIVQPRAKKHVLYNGELRQFGSVVKDHRKENIIKRRRFLPDVSRTAGGKGDIYKTSLIVKMLVVAANKFASLDPFGTGIEMEADKPNWYDSLNGLPGLFGSSVCETFELKRWILFLRDNIKKLSATEQRNVDLPIELYVFLSGLGKLSKQRLGFYDFWDKRNRLKEKYRDATLFGFSGIERKAGLKEIKDILNNFSRIIDRGLRRAFDEKTGLYLSYFIHKAIGHKIISRTEERIYAKAVGFSQNPLPVFLEGMVHAFRVNSKQDILSDFYKAIKKSSLFDRKLGMYKVCSSLSRMPEEIGRARVFTPGWLENESVWLHMEYKYMLELLKAGLYRNFYNDFRKVFVCFLKPAVYGRSILENSSFIVSSAFPEKEMHGNGFVARLSGSTAEFINIWLIMCAGSRPFRLDENNNLCAEFKPVLASWLFTQKKEQGFKRDTFSFRFLSETLVVYHNPHRKDTFGRSGAKVKRVIMHLASGKRISQDSSVISAPYSYDLRNGKIPRIDIELH
jgi:hypothetical protein